MVDDDNDVFYFFILLTFMTQTTARILGCCHFKTECMHGLNILTHIRNILTQLFANDITKRIRAETGILT